MAAQDTTQYVNNNKPHLDVDVFISHTFQDREACMFAIMLNECLKKEGIQTFFDFQIDMGTDFKEEILTALRNCQTFVCILSPEFFDRMWCLREIHLAIGYQKPIFPVFFRDLDGSDENVNKILTELKGLQCWRKPYSSKRDVVRIKDEIIDALKKRLGFVIPKNKPVTISLASDDVYTPTQMGWCLGTGEHRIAIDEAGKSYCCARIHEDKKSSFLLLPSPSAIADEGRHGYAIVAIDKDGRHTGALMVDVDGWSVNRDNFSNYVFISADNPQRTYPWRLIPQGKHEFRILYQRKINGSETHAYSNHSQDGSTRNPQGQPDRGQIAPLSLQEHLIDAKFMGLASHRFWVSDVETDEEEGRWTNVMVSLQNEFRYNWIIKAVPSESEVRARL